MPSKKLCFIISPIGPDGSETRQNADDFLELIVEPALEKYDFEVVRADRIAQPSAITADIIRLVQEADLCIIDVTGNNPNVFYECGRRHETGRPFIQMVRKGSESSLPFDVAGIRTVTYDATEPRKVLDSKRRLQEFIEALIASGFESVTSGQSLASVAQGIERIERKLSALLSSNSTGSAFAGRKSVEIADLIKPPKEAFIDAIKQGKLDFAFTVLDRIKKISEASEYMSALALLVTLGNDRAYELMDADLSAILARREPMAEDGECVKVCAQAFQNYHTNNAQLKQGLAKLEDLVGVVMSRDSFSKEVKAFTANQAGMMAWMLREFDTCSRHTRVALELHQDPSYAYNLALVYARKDMKKELDEVLGRLSQMDGLDDDHRALLHRHGY